MLDVGDVCWHAGGAGGCGGAPGLGCWAETEAGSIRINVSPMKVDTTLAVLAMPTFFMMPPNREVMCSKYRPKYFSIANKNRRSAIRRSFNRIAVFPALLYKFIGGARCDILRGIKYRGPDADTGRGASARLVNRERDHNARILSAHAQCTRQCLQSAF